MLADLVSVYAARRPGWDNDAGGSTGGGGDVGGAGGVRVLDAEVLGPGRPGIVDVVAELGDRFVHVPFGLRTPGEEARFIPDGDDAVLGSLVDDDGSAIVFDATRDAVVAAMLLERVSGEVVQASLVRHLRDDRGSVTLAMEDRIAFTVFNEVVDGPRPDLELFLALDEVGFNHLAAPLAVWRRAGRDLGVAQEYLAGASSGYVLAPTSVRDLYASGGPPELAGGDFGAEAHRLGTMTARMHLGLDKAFGRPAPATSASGPWAFRTRCAPSRPMCSSVPMSKSCSASCAPSRYRHRPSVPMGISIWVGPVGPSRGGTSSILPLRVARHRWPAP